jgi:hypothetical protein
MTTATKQPTKRQQLINFYATFSEYKKEVYKETEIHTFLNQKGLPTCAIYESTRGVKPTYVYCFKSEEQRAQFIQERKKQADIRAAANAIRNAQHNAEKEQIKEGSIFVSSWGWEQTNIDFYIVLERKKDFVLIQEIGQHRTHTHDMQGTCTPNKEKLIGEPFKKKINKWAGLSLDSYKYCQLWDGNPKGWSSYA